MPSLCKHHLDTADAKKPKHHHFTFGIHIKQSLEPQSTCPAYANTIWNHIKQLWSHSSHAQPMQTPSGHCRCKKTQTPSRHEAKYRPNRKPKNCFTLPLESPQTIFGATEHMPSLCKHHLDTADAKRPKHHLDTSRKPPKPQAKKLFHVAFGIHIKQTLEPQSTSPAYANTSLCKHHLDTADAKRPKHHLDTSRKPPKPQAKKLFHVTFGIHIKQSLEPQSTCPAYANTIWNHIKQLWSHRAHAQPMQTPSGHCRCKKTQHHLDTSRIPPKPQAKKLFHVNFGLHIKQKNNLWSHRAHAQPMQTPSGHCRCKRTQTPSRHEPKTAQTASQKTIFGATSHAQPMQTPSGTT